MGGASLHRPEPALRHPTRRPRLAPLAALALAVAACAKDPAPPAWSPEEVTPRAMAGFCAEAVPAWCDHLARCRPEEAREPYQDCLVGQGAAWCEGLVSAGREAAAAAGRLEWVPILAGHCVQDLAAPTCRTVAAEQGCARVFAGRVAPGQACLEEAECRLGGCTAAATCPATCAGRADVGEPCADHAACGAGLLCYRADRSDFCGGAAGCTCAPAADPSAGAPCSEAPGAAPCAAGQRCLAGRCEPVRAGPGEPCRGGRPCDGDLACLADEGDRCGPPRSGGERCLLIDECAAGLTCRQGGRCGPFVEGPATCRPFAGAGGDCALGWSCAPDGRCVRRPTSAGATCASRLELGAPGLAPCFGAGIACGLEGGAWTCLPPALLGEACGDRPCADAAQGCVHRCTATACQRACEARQEAGAACGTDDACRSGACLPDRTCAPACAAP